MPCIKCGGVKSEATGKREKILVPDPEMKERMYKMLFAEFKCKDCGAVRLEPASHPPDNRQVAALRYFLANQRGVKPICRKKIQPE